MAPPATAALSAATVASASAAAPSAGPESAAGLPAQYEQQFLRMDDGYVEYMSASQLQALMEPTCTKTSTAYILFYTRATDDG